jgi:hypothetical protein
VSNKNEMSQLPLTFSVQIEKVDVAKSASKTNACKVVDLDAVKIGRTRQIAYEQLSKLGLIKRPS